ncbi:493e0586-d4b9-4b27-bacd-3f5f4be70b14 [Thermothielavioides terrestris]|jgi:hypothetical protein
MLAF